MRKSNATILQEMLDEIGAELISVVEATLKDRGVVLGLKDKAAVILAVQAKIEEIGAERAAGGNGRVE